MQEVNRPVVALQAIVIRRYLARAVDLLLLFALLVGLTPVDPMSWYGTALAAAVLIPVETAMTWLFSATPGKFLLRLRIHAVNGVPITLLQALKRSVLVWIFGQAAGIAVLMPFSAGISYGRLKEGRETIWDEWSHTTVGRLD